MFVLGADAGKFCFWPMVKLGLVKVQEIFSTFKVYVRHSQSVPQLQSVLALSVLVAAVRLYLRRLTATRV